MIVHRAHILSVPFIGMSGTVYQNLYESIFSDEKMALVYITECLLMINVRV